MVPHDGPPPARLDGSVVTARIGGREFLFFVVNPADAIQRHHLAGTFFEPEELAILARHLPPGGAYLDIGANVGNHALFVAAFCRPGAVICVEPNPPAAALLRLNARLNGFADWDFSLLGCALSDRDGWMTPEPAPADNLGGQQFRPGQHAGETGSVRCLRGDGVFAARRIDLVKIDVEGHEMAVLAGLAETVARWRPVLFAEIGDYHAAQFAAWCDEAGYRVAERFERYAGLPNLLALPR